MHILETASCKYFKLMKIEHFQTLWNETERFLEFRSALPGLGTLNWYQSLATSFLPANFRSFSNCSGIV